MGVYWGRKTGYRDHKDKKKKYKCGGVSGALVESSVAAEGKGWVNESAFRNWEWSELGWVS